MTCKRGHSILKAKCDHCQLLKTKWYKKAHKKDVYEDIEDANGDLTDHQSILDLYQRKDFQTVEVYQAKIEYYSWAEQMLEKADFKSQKDKKIWKYHIKGFSRREISPKVGLEGSWISRKVKIIQKYLKNQGH